MEILTREGKSSWFPSGVYFSRVNGVSLSFLFLLGQTTGSSSASCFNHFLPDMSNGSAQPVTPLPEGGRGDRKDAWLLREVQSVHQGMLLRPAWWCHSGHRVMCALDAEMRMKGDSHQGERSPGKWGWSAQKLQCSEEAWETWLLKVPQSFSKVTCDAAHWKVFQVGTRGGIYSSSLSKWTGSPKMLGRMMYGHGEGGWVSLVRLTQVTRWSCASTWQELGHGTAGTGHQWDAQTGKELPRNYEVPPEWNCCALL